MGMGAPCGAIAYRARVYMAIWGRVWGLRLWEHLVQGVGSHSVGPFGSGCGAVLWGEPGGHRQPLLYGGT